MKMTPFEQRILDQVNEQGQHIYNGRAFKQIERLKQAGLVNADFDLHLSANGKTLWRIHVTRKEVSQ